MSKQIISNKFSSKFLIHQTSKIGITSTYFFFFYHHPWTCCMSFMEGNCQPYRTFMGNCMSTSMGTLCYIILLWSSIICNIILLGIFLKIIWMGFCGLALCDKYCADSRNTHLVPTPTMKGTLIILPYCLTPSLISSNITSWGEKTLRIL